MRLSTAPRFGWKMSLIFLVREVLLPDAAFDLVSREFTVAAFGFVVVTAFDLADGAEFSFEVLMQCKECCLCCKEYHREHKKFHSGGQK